MPMTSEAETTGVSPTEPLVISILYSQTSFVTPSIIIKYRSPTVSPDAIKMSPNPGAKDSQITLVKLKQSFDFKTLN